MKRSHAITVIAECLIEPHFPDDAMREAEFILRRLEDYKLIQPPPSYHIKLKEVLGLPGTQSFVKDGMYTTNQWEPEDGDEE